MALFPKHPVAARDPQPVGYSVFDTQMSVDGDVETDASLRIDGRLRGSVRSAGVVVVAAGAAVIGDVAAREIIVGGAITGNVTATQRIELQESAVVTGDIEASAIMIQEGGSVEGRMTIHPTSMTVSGTERAATSAAPHLRAALGGNAG
ncbi:MAG: polymer-forming cytoskeletal protein [Gemmatimonadaceae bacterium]|nr:polymer-forming cytoskeletal protein [Gemmatimonadaceae bacterium]